MIKIVKYIVSDFREFQRKKKCLSGCEFENIYLNSLNGKFKKKCKNCGDIAKESEITRCDGDHSYKTAGYLMEQGEIIKKCTKCDKTIYKKVTDKSECKLNDVLFLNY